MYALECNIIQIMQQNDNTSSRLVVLIFKKGYLIVFYAFWVIYTVKELDSRAKHSQSGCSLFLQGSKGVSQTCLFVPVICSDECFMNKAQFDTGFVHRLMLKDGVVSVIKDHGHGYRR